MPETELTPESFDFEKLFAHRPGEELLDRWSDRRPHRCSDAERAKQPIGKATT